jgi:hypothetical protein
VALVPGVQLISLQRGFGEEQSAAFLGSWPLLDLRGEVDESAGPFLETAAVIANLDLVIACDSAIAHLAGALGVPVWIALPFAPDWRWFLERVDSPWYPSARLFRQATGGDWNSVFEQVALALRTGEASPRPKSPGPASVSNLTASPSLSADAPPAHSQAAPVLIEVSVGELLDKITILEIKKARIADPGKLRNVCNELEVLSAARDTGVPRSIALDELVKELTKVNEALWDIEDEIRVCERGRDFGPRFIELARSVYQTNDRRAELKRAINDMVGSRLVEEKSYQGGEGAGESGTQL